MKTNPILMKGTKGAPIQKNMHGSAFRAEETKEEPLITSPGKELPRLGMKQTQIKKLGKKIGMIQNQPIYQGGTLPEVTVKG